MTKLKSRATLAIVDGADPAVLEELAVAGDLPNISRLVLEPGGLVPATTVFPSTTGVAYLPFLTGCYPGTCDVPGIRWMDVAQYKGRWCRDRAQVRNYCGVQGGRLNTDIPDHIPSIFDIEKDSVALCSPFIRRLPKKRQLTRMSRAVIGGLSHYTRGYKRLDLKVGRDLAKVAQKHRFKFAVFPGVDGLVHTYGSRHPKVLDLYREFDRTVGRYEAAGGLDGDQLLIIASDHGMTRIDLHSDVATELERRGLRVLRHPKLWRSDPLLAVMVSGNASAQLYLQPGVPRTHRWSIPSIESGDVAGIPKNLIDLLADVNGVALVAGVDGEDVVVVSREGRARLVDLGDGLIRYDPETADVLELSQYSSDRHEREWLVDSLDGRFPDAPAQLLQLFRSARTGDLVLSASENADLRQEWEIPEHRSGHGGLIRDHMRCLVASNRPVEGPLRTADLFSLVLEHLGHRIPVGTDSLSGLREELVTAQ